MKKHHTLCIPAATAALLNSGCGLVRTGPTDAEISRQAYRRGYMAARAHIARRQVHEEQRRLAAPPEPLPKRYHRVPVPSYTGEDGVLRENHHIIVETVTPPANTP